MEWLLIVTLVSSIEILEHSSRGVWELAFISPGRWMKKKNLQNSKILDRLNPAPLSSTYSNLLLRLSSRRSNVWGFLRLSFSLVLRLSTRLLPRFSNLPAGTSVSNRRSTATQIPNSETPCNRSWNRNSVREASMASRRAFSMTTRCLIIVSPQSRSTAKLLSRTKEYVISTHHLMNLCFCLSNFYGCICRVWFWFRAFIIQPVIQLHSQVSAPNKRWTLQVSLTWVPLLALEALLPPAGMDSPPKQESDGRKISMRSLLTVLIALVVLRVSKTKTKPDLIMEFFLEDVGISKLICC